MRRVWARPRVPHDVLPRDHGASLLELRSRRAPDLAAGEGMGAMTPLLIEMACAFDSCAGYAAGPWDFSVGDCTLTLEGRVIEPTTWESMAQLAAGSSEAERWLAVLREDVADRLDTRARFGSIWEPVK